MHDIKIEDIYLRCVLYFISSNILQRASEEIRIVLNEVTSLNKVFIVCYCLLLLYTILSV